MGYQRGFCFSFSSARGDECEWEIRKYAFHF